MFSTRDSDNRPREWAKHKSIYSFHKQVAGVFIIPMDCTFLRINGFDVIE